MKDRKEMFTMNSQNKFKKTSSKDDDEESDFSKPIIKKEENLFTKKIKVKNSEIYFSEKLKLKFYSYQKCLFICLFIYIFDYLIWFISRKSLKDVINILALLFSLIYNLYCLYLFKDEFDFVNNKIYNRIKTLIKINIIILILHYINLLILFIDKIIIENFDGLLHKIFPNNRKLKIFYGIYLLVNFFFPAVTLFYLNGVKKSVNVVGTMKGEDYEAPHFELKNIKRSVGIK